jgi:G2/mitotic-specific cyclin 3/4
MKPKASYIGMRPDLHWRRRHLLLGWLVEVHTHLKLVPEILFLAVNCFDRYLSCTEVPVGKLQLVGATALFIASKYEDRYLSITTIVHMAAGAFSVDDLFDAEFLMLITLGFNLEWPGPMSFLRRISRADNYDVEIRTLSKYFLEITVMDERFLDCVPSFLSAGSYCLALFMLKKGDWVFLCLLHHW